MTYQTIFKEINILYCGYEECEPNHSYGPALRSCNVIHFVLSGKGSLDICGKHYNIQKGTGFFFPPETLVSYRADNNNPWEYLWFAFTGSHAEECLYNSGISKQSPIFEFDIENNSQIIKHIIKSLQNAENQYTMLGSVISLFSNILGEISFETPQEKYIRKATEYMNINLSSGATVLNAALYAGIDKSYLHKLFKEHLAKSPAEYLVMLRMKEASRLIKNSTLSLENIAHSVGYSDGFIFSKAFKKYYGVSPSLYRKNFIKNEFL